MNAPAAIQRATEGDLYKVLSERTLPVLQAALVRAERGQRLRVTTLPEPVMVRLCQQLQGDRRWMDRILVVDRPSEPWQATATKLIEYRNVLPEPLLVFVPPGLRTAAEDSLDIATFNELSLNRLASDLAGVLLDRLPEELRGSVRDALEYLRLERIVRHPDQEIDYLLTVHKNAGTKRAAGGALFAFGLVPDFKLFEGGSHRKRLSRNAKARAELADLRRPLQERISRLPLEPDTVQRCLFTFLRHRHAEDTQAWATEVACDAAHHHLAFDGWKYQEGDREQDLRIVVDKIDLPRQTEDRVQGSVRMRVLDLAGKQGLKVTFRSLPPPSQVDAWTDRPRKNGGSGLNWNEGFKTFIPSPLSLPGRGSGTSRRWPRSAGRGYSGVSGPLKRTRRTENSSSAPGTSAGSTSG